METDQPPHVPLLELFWLRRRNARREKLLKGWLPHLPPRVRTCQFQNLLIDAHNKAAVEKVKKYVASVVKSNFENCGNLILTGPAGRGKSTIAWGALFHAIELVHRRDRDVLSRLKSYTYFTSEFIVVPRFEQAMRTVVGGGSGIPQNEIPYDWTAREFTATVEGSTDWLSGLDLLVLDEFVLGQASNFTTDLMYSIIDARWVMCKPTIITCNKPLGTAVNNGLIDDRIVDRLMQAATHISLQGPSRRRGDAANSLLHLKPALDLGFEEDPDPALVVSERQVWPEREVYQKWQNMRRESEREGR